ncbi:MAG: (E)-4-hydroxy-3-methylbut-2-enyl-diphosphate synthase [Elusimicrobiota bacterium]
MASPAATLQRLFPGSDPFRYGRRRTRVVRAGKLAIGGDEPIRLQSMTTTATSDVEAAVAQALRLVEAGCELVRVTAPTVEDARALGRIKAGLLRRGVDVPLAADIHFSPQAALEAAEFVEKVRINPGNFADSKRSASRGGGEAEYARELARIEEAFTPLVEKLKRLGRALRIGANHGSLSDRILNRYGDTPAGMVESALEYARICEKLGYRELVFSMKASNPKVTVAAYRLLSSRMSEAGMDYPFHLGVTEAGGGVDGRIKSAIGIGALLEDGLGDTIRVSLTEDPEFELPVCRALARRFGPAAPPPPAPVEAPAPFCADLFSYARRESASVRVGPFRIGERHPVRAFAAVDAGVGAEEIEALLRGGELEPEVLELEVAAPADRTRLKDLRAALGAHSSRLAFLARFRDPALLSEGLPLCDLAAFCAPDEEAWAGFVRAAKTAGKPVLASGRDAGHCAAREAVCRREGVPALAQLCASAEGRSPLQEYRLLCARLAAAGSKAPLHLRAPAQEDAELRVLEASLLVGGLLCDGLGDSAGIVSGLRPAESLRLLYDVLQGAGARVVKAELVSCPSCGRTLFDIQSASARIGARVRHLKGVKIAVMGCIVNGPGEMADADFGYVGGAPGKINLYVGKDCVQKGVPSAEADDALIALIRKNGRWSEPPARE